MVAIVTSAGLGLDRSSVHTLGSEGQLGDATFGRYGEKVYVNADTGNLMIDFMNGTSISSTQTITVGDPSWHAVSTGEFNGQAEIAWQNTNGAVGIWLMNGTTPVAQAGLANPGAGWQLISIDHFTTNGQADLLFQNNNNNAMMLWEINGTSVAATLNGPTADYPRPAGGGSVSISFAHCPAAAVSSARRG